MISRENLAFIAATSAGVILLFAVGLSRPDLLIEDGPLENVGAAGFAVAALFALGVALRGGALLTLTERRLLIGTGGLSLLLFLSEISFGARIFDFQMPQLSGGGEFDGGHDIVIVLTRRLSDAGPTGMLVAAAVAGLLVVAAIILLRVFRQQAQATIRSVLSKAFEFRLTVALCMLASAVTLDLVRSHKAGVLEEVLEFSASAVLILAVAALLRHEDSRTQGQGSPAHPASPAAADR